MSQPDANRLWLTPNQDGTTVTFNWRFDYYWQYGRGKGKKTKQEVLELFALSSDPVAFDWSSTAPQQITGEFELSWFQKIGKSITHNWTSHGTAELTFLLRIEPV